jgi:hypothetical protein
MSRIHCIKFERNEVTIDYRPEDAAIVIAIKDRPILSVNQEGVSCHDPHEPQITFTSPRFPDAVGAIYDALIEDFASLYNWLKQIRDCDERAGSAAANYVGAIVNKCAPIEKQDDLRPGMTLGGIKSEREGVQ